MIRFENVSRTYPAKSGQVNALDDVTLEIPPGQFVCVRGPSGCGKTTFLLTLGGMLRPSSGRVFVRRDGQDNVDLYSLSNADRALYRAGDVGFVFQLFHLVPYLNVLENVLLGPRRGAQDRQKAKALLEELGLSHRITHKPSELSIGERQRAAIARAMLRQPPLILADEPTGNLDPENEKEVFGILERFHAGGGTVVVVTHGNAADAYADRHVRLEAGRVTDDSLNSPLRKCSVAKIETSRPESRS